MSTLLTCAQCQQTFATQPNLDGQPLRCPQCQGQIEGADDVPLADFADGANEHPPLPSLFPGSPPQSPADPSRAPLLPEPKSAGARGGPRGVLVLVLILVASLSAGVLGIAVGAGVMWWSQRPGNAWSQFEPPGGACSVSMPGTPVPQAVPSAPGVDNVRSYQARAEASSTILTFSFFDVTEEAMARTPFAQRCQTSAEMGAKTFGGRVTRQMDIQLDGYRGRENHVEAAGKGMAINRLYLVPMRPSYRIYILTAEGPHVQPNTGDAARFFDSFCLDPRLKPAPAEDDFTPPEPLHVPFPEHPPQAVTEVRTFRAHAQGPQRLAFTSRGQLISCGGDNLVRIWTAPDFSPHSSRPLGGPATGHFALTPDGSTLALPTDKGVAVYDTTTDSGPSLIEIPHSQVKRGYAITSVALRPDAKVLVAALSGDHLFSNTPAEVHFVDIRGHKPLVPPQPFAGTVRAVAWSPDGATVAIAAGSNVHLQHADTHRQRHNLPGHWDTVESLAFSPDGQVLASAGRDRTIRLWETATGKLRSVLEGHTRPVVSLAFRGDNSCLASSDEAGSVALWELATKRNLEVRSFGPTSPVVPVAFSHDDHWLVCGLPDGQVKVWDVGKLLSAPTLLYQIPPPLGGNAALAFAPDSKTLATGGGDGYLRLWDVPYLTERASRPGHTGAVSAIAYRPDGKLLATGSEEGLVCLRDPARGMLIRSFQLLGELTAPRRVNFPRASVQALAFSPGGKLLAMSLADWPSPEGRVHVWDLEADRDLGKLGADSHGPNSLAFAPEGNTLAMACVGCVRLWDPATLGEQGRLDVKDNEPVIGVAYSPDGRLLAAANSSRVYVWNTKSGAVVKELPLKGAGRAVNPQVSEEQAVASLAFSPDGRLLAFGDRRGGLHLHHLASGAEQVVKLPVTAVPRLAFSPDGRMLAILGLWLVDVTPLARWPARR